MTTASRPHDTDAPRAWFGHEACAWTDFGTARVA